MGGGTPDMFEESLGRAQRGVVAAGREGKPRTAALFYFALGDDAERGGAEQPRRLLLVPGRLREPDRGLAAKDADTLKAYKAAFEEAGADEIICFPASPDPAQVELLAEAVL